MMIVRIAGYACG